MNSTQQHIIDKVYLEIDLKDEKKAYWIKDNISTFLNTDVFPGFEKLFSKWSDAESISRFERIDLEIEVDNMDQLADLRFELEKQLQQKLAFSALEKRYPVNGEQSFKDRSLNSAVAKGLSPAQNTQAIFMFFLQHGYLPWYGKKSNIDTIISEEEWTKRLQQADFIAELKQLLIGDRSALKRFVLQMPLTNVLQFIAAEKMTENQQFTSLKEYLLNLDLNNRNQFLSVLVQIFVGYKKSDWKAELLDFMANAILENQDSDKSYTDRIIELAKQLQNISQHTTFEFTQNDSDTILAMLEKQSRKNVAEKGVTQKRGKIENDPSIISHGLSFTNEKEPLFFEKDAGEIAVQNAGQVLFHPFLKTFLQQFQWLDDAGQIREKERIKAVQALHYCATGSDQFFEGDLVLEKFLCGVPLKTTLPATSLLDEIVRTEADNMLRELIKNWPALKNTSPDGLREMFVSRNGKLIQKDRNFKLIIERKTQDILLEKLQWNISIIKLPWLNNLIFVEW
ncbi:contractile injection system tape measure protein [Maribellus sediminis]|uniref:contractile injection system tape measure protein n=1 Tax=Maribellus sediminis TaxID=2696285 RepID=UPI0014306DC1|nr:contractile injection system tape measure protein [Maribellus sediminis]